MSEECERSESQCTTVYVHPEILNIAYIYHYVFVIFCFVSVLSMFFGIFLWLVCTTPEDAAADSRTIDRGDNTIKFLEISRFCFL